MFAGINTFISTLASEDEARASDLLTPLTSERECNTTLMYRLVSQHLFWDFTITYSRRRGCSLITLGYRTLFIHWVTLAIWLVFHCSIVITADFSRAKEVDLLLRFMYSHVILALFDEHIPMWSIGQWIAQ